MEYTTGILMRIKDKMMAEKGDVPTSYRKCSGMLGMYGLWFRVLGRKHLDACMDSKKKPDTYARISNAS